MSSPRVAGSCDPVVQQVIARCEEWAEWYSQEGGEGLGYPAVSPLYRLVRGQTHVSSPAASHVAAEEMEGWVCEMSDQNPEMADVLRAYYFHPGTLRAHAIQQGISHSQFKFVLGMAHQWLAGRMRGMRHAEIPCFRPE